MFMAYRYYIWFDVLNFTTHATTQKRKAGDGCVKVTADSIHEARKLADQHFLNYDIELYGLVPAGERTGKVKTAFRPHYPPGTTYSR